MHNIVGVKEGLCPAAFSHLIRFLESRVLSASLPVPRSKNLVLPVPGTPWGLLYPVAEASGRSFLGLLSQHLFIWSSAYRMLAFISSYSLSLWLTVLQ